jgi:predicted TPR repeat methyltransferase
VAGAHIAPQSQLLVSRVSQLASDAKRAANNLDRDADPSAFIAAWREVLWLDPSSILAATKLAWIHERLNPQDATDAWVKVLGIEPDNEQANARSRA